MSSQLISALHLEERSIVAELRASTPFQRLEGVRRLLALYEAQPSVETGLDMPTTAEPERASASVVQIGQATSAVGQAFVAPSAPLAATATTAIAAVPEAANPPIGFAETQASIPLPGPTLAEASSVDAAWSHPGPGPQNESATVVSSVRAALLGIGRG